MTVESYELWMDRAKRYLDAAFDHELDSRGEAIVFECHHAVELLLKGLFILQCKGIYPPRVHSLHRLALELKFSSDMPENIAITLDELDGIYVFSKYPDLEECSIFDDLYEIERLRTDTKEVFEWLLEKAI